MSVTAPEAMSFGLVIRDPGHNIISHTHCPLGLHSLYYIFIIQGARRPLTKSPYRLHPQDIPIIPV